MPLSLRRGRVTAILEELDGLVRLEVNGEACVAYPGLTGPVAVDDDVLVNVQARDLALGSGGFDVLYANLTRGLGLSATEGAHVMKLPYTPLQAAAVHAEEGGGLAEELGGLPVVCAIGPGIVGTGSRLGHGGLAAADAANAASALGGSPVLAARVSSADERERHRGVSHHTEAVLALCTGRVVVAWPAGQEAPDWVEPRQEVDVEGWEDACAGLPLSHMGRGPAEEPWFFAAAFAAGRLGRSLVA